jgi:adenine/guanine phosphoribosyltransferase-like PRPP-binding protein
MSATRLTADALRLTGGYMNSVYAYDEVLERAKALRAPKFDTFVGTGLSGAVIVPRLAEDLGLNWLVVRKDNDGSHSDLPVEGTLGRRWLFVDDFVSTGATFKRVHSVIEAVTAHRQRYNIETHEYENDPWDTRLVGIWEYQYGRRYSLSEIRSRFKVGLPASDLTPQAS